MNIVDFKSELDTLTTNLLSEYMKLETMYLQEKKRNTDSLTTINSKNTSICESLQSKVNEIYGLEKEILGYKSREQEYSNVIDNLRQQIKDFQETKEITEEGNKFDMLRCQAKEISAKDKEIIRLTKELVRLIEMNEMKQILSMVIKDSPKNEVTGWAPTSKSGPKPDIEDVSDENSCDDDEAEEVSIIYYRKKQYYKDNEDKVNDIENDEEVGPCIGDRVKQDYG